MFTDGYPAENGTDNINYTLCDNAIASAQTSKRTYGATVYTVGIFSGANPNSNIDTNFDYGNRRDAEKQLVAANRYMHYTSSNFQNAKSLRNGGEKSGSSYYPVSYTHLDSAGNGSPRVVYEGASGENNGGLVMSKTVTKGEGDDQFLLTLEACLLYTS